MKVLKPASEMDDQEQIFSYLPPEIIVNILSRIPIKTVFTCKCVSKLWLELLESPEFARSHLSKSVPGLLFNHVMFAYDTEMAVFKIFEFEDSPEIIRHELHYKLVLELGIDSILSFIYCSEASIKGSANGLLYLQNTSHHYVCNPITQEYIQLPEPEGISLIGTVVPHGFGVSRFSNHYKAVRISRNCIRDVNTGSLLSFPKPVCQVDTLGTGSWRSISTPCDMLLNYSCSKGKPVNGNLHWLARDFTRTWWISCFDLETEVLTKFRPPEGKSKGHHLSDIGVLRDRLCLFDNSSKTKIRIYMMNDYGGEKVSWNMEYVISNNPLLPNESNNVVCALKAFADGDLLMVSDYHPKIRYYSNRTKTIEPAGDIFNIDRYGCFQAILYTPSFVSLKGFQTENVKVSELVCVMS